MLFRTPRGRRRWAPPLRGWCSGGSKSRGLDCAMVPCDSVPAGGEAGVRFVIPDSLALVGAQLHVQVLGLEFDPALNLIALTGSNRVTLTGGAF